MEGIETQGIRHRLDFRSVSRCPDMEGIETSNHVLSLGGVRMSVGAPTWRGLKLYSGLAAFFSSVVSVGAPTWRGLKLTVSSVGVSLNLYQ